MDLQIQYAGFLASHPSSAGDDITQIVVRNQGATTWTPVWSDCRGRDARDSMTIEDPGRFFGSVVEIGNRYDGTYAHEEWLDTFQVDDSPLPARLQSTCLTFPNLPTAVATAPYVQDFESGSVPPEMALTAVDAVTPQPDPDAWCTITIGSVWSGAYALQMGVSPSVGSPLAVRNAMVLALDLSSLSRPALEFALGEWWESPGDLDGVWISDDGASWYQLPIA